MVEYRSPTEVGPLADPPETEVLDYARDLARELAGLASAAGAHTLSALFRAAEAEAARETVLRKAPDRV